MCNCNGNKWLAIDITSVSQYLDEIKKIPFEQGMESMKKPLYFRGEPECYEHVKASLFRGKQGEKDKTNVDDEYNIIHNALTQHPEVFGHCRSDMDRLVTMQHFRLPTRLVDVTSNPLVALYFACENYNTDDVHAGRVLYINDMEPEDNETIDMLSSIASIYCIAQFKLNQILFKIREKNTLLNCLKKEETKYSILFQSISKPYLFQPTLSNERIRAQQGAFIISPLAEAFNGSKTLFESLTTRGDSMWSIEEMLSIEFIKTQSCICGLFNPTFFRVLPENKKKIIEELDKCGINKGTVYPDPEHQMINIAERNIRHKQSDTLDVYFD